MSESNSSTASPTAPVSEGSTAAEGAAPAATAAPTPAEIRKMKLKVDGQEVEMGEDEVIRYAQQGKASNQRFQEAAKMRKEAEDMISLIKRDPIAVLNDPRIGHNFRKLAEEYLSEQLKQEMMTPEQKRVAEMEKKMRGYQDQEKAQKAQVEAQQMKQLQDHYANDFSTKITTALSTQGVPKTPATVKRMAALMSQNLQHGLDLQPADLARLVKEDYLAEMKEMFSASDEDTLLGLLGDDTANKIRKADLKRLRAGSNPAPQGKPQVSRERSEPSGKKETPEQFFARIKKQI